MSTELLPAFNTRRYSKDDPRIVHDLAATMIEGSGKVMPYTLTYLENGKVVQILKNTPLEKISDLDDVENFYDLTTPGGKAGLQIRDILVHEPVNTGAVWLSPPGGKYKHASIQVGYVTDSVFGEKDLSSFGFQLIISTEHVFRLARSINSFKDNRYTFNSTDGLRNIVFKLNIPKNTDPVSYLKQLLPIDLWSDVEKGEVYKYWERALNDAKLTIKKRKEQIESAQNKKDHYIAGAGAEFDMISRGWSTAYLDCDLPNSALLNSTNIIVSKGLASFSRETVRTLDCECGICHKRVNAKIVGGKIYCPRLNCKGNKGVPYKC